MNKEIEFLKSIINKDDIVVVACSGGPDSMCLLSLVNNIKSLYNLKVIVAHVNHKVRIESNEEAIMVQKYCNNNDLIFKLFEINEYKNNKFTESDAREKRYKFFEKVLEEYQAKILLTAHHGDDLIETILMRLTRGSNLNGYIGIRKVMENNNYKIIRPLLTTDKKHILKYLEDNNIDYAIDETNNLMEHTRNR
ncbi:tRNA lysidine(34) synthetase TilS, partial [bacterium]|nr:tRNA lysidine(34) synthetase TilS [bacterium]